jgi:DNA-binding transcriptional ArsR family regulator
MKFGSYTFRRQCGHRVSVPLFACDVSRLQSRRKDTNEHIKLRKALATAIRRLKKHPCELCHPNATMTPRQREVFDVIIQLFERNGYSPSVREIARKASMSDSRVRQHLAVLERCGIIKREVGTARSIRICC